jgi:predicted ribosome quality control (RQC) complex YloA/Tae2 family protein
MKTIIREFEFGSIDFLVGQNAQENHDLIDGSVEQDVWFHVSGNPSCHVIGKLPQDVHLDKSDLMKIVKQGAVICKSFSKCKSDKNVKIYYTTIKNIKKLKTPGSVSIVNAKSVII